MTEKPIIFSTPMVQAILDGRKTQTRRVVKPQNIPCFGCGEVKGYWLDNETYWAKRGITKEDCTNTLFCECCNDQIEYEHTRGGAKCKVITSPYQPGDILWVQETWQKIWNPEWEHDGKPIYDLIENFNDISKVVIPHEELQKN